MIEIKHPLKEQFLVVIENGILLFLFKPKDLWIRFEGAPDALKWQTYSLIKQLLKFGYLRKEYDDEGNQFYSETDKLTDFRITHCKEKAVKVLTKKLRLLKQEQLEKTLEIQETNELSKQLPEINYCFKNYIRDRSKKISRLENHKNIISKIINDIDSFIY